MHYSYINYYLQNKTNFKEYIKFYIYKITKNYTIINYKEIKIFVLSKIYYSYHIKKIIKNNKI